MPTLYDRLGHTLCKGLPEPNFWLQGPLFCDSLFDDIFDGMLHDPILVKGLVGFIRKISIVGFPRIILFGMKWFVENGVLVRQLCRVDQKLRPLLSHPSVNLSWETIRELLQLHHFFQTSDIRGRFFALDPTIERECEPKCKIGISFISEFIQSSKSLPMKLRNALVR